MTVSQNPRHGQIYIWPWPIYHPPLLWWIKMNAFLFYSRQLNFDLCNNGAFEKRSFPILEIPWQHRGWKEWRAVISIHKATHSWKEEEEVQSGREREKAKLFAALWDNRSIRPACSVEPKLVHCTGSLWRTTQHKLYSGNTKMSRNQKYIAYMLCFVKTQCKAYQGLLINAFGVNLFCFEAVFFSPHRKIGQM